MPSSASVEASAVVYEVVHTTRYTYSHPVSLSQHIARLTPRQLPYQRSLESRLDIVPAPAVRVEHLDYFGNMATMFAMTGGHSELNITARSRVRVQARPALRRQESPPWEAAANHERLPIEALDCLFDSPSIRTAPEYAEYALVSFRPRRSLLDAFVELTHRIHEDFAFEPGTTTVATDLAEVFRLRRGVCQDFACLQIACLRSIGLAAQYISGYLETQPPPGRPRLVGADASHAWVAVYCPRIGWIEADPTNDVLPSTAHVTLARGRDYGDVSPLRGVILGGGEHTLHVGVDVARA